MSADQTPLADLHRHLDGSLRPATVRELAAAAGKPLPAALHFTPGMGLPAALALFQFTLALLRSPSNVRRVASEICEDARADGVSTLEIRFAPQLHRGATPAAIVDAALEGIAGRAGLVLCGLYGEPPAVLDELVDLGANRPGVVGIDLAGGPRLEHSWGMAEYAPAFRRAGEVGLGRTVHAGEGRAAAEIRTAVELLGAERVGHGATVLDDPAVVELLVERAVTIEACPTSNVHVGVIDSVAQHPLPRWLDLGLRACICTDNTLFSRIDAREEHRRAAEIPGMTEAHLARTIACGHSAAFRRGG